MPKLSQAKCIGILNSGGDCPGLNAAIRAVTKTVVKEYGMRVIGIQDGFRGLIENRTVNLEDRDVSGILTLGGTILGSSRDKPHKMRMGGRTINMIDVAAANVRNLHIDCLVCLGGGGTQKNALRLHQEGGVNVLTLPKTIDNDVHGTDFSFGFDTALQIATDAIDRLHTTATSHHRIIVCEIMGHSAGWLALGAGIAGGADVILIPELPYDVSVVSEFLLERRRSGRRFSIVALAEGAKSWDDIKAAQKTRDKKPAGDGKKMSDLNGIDDLARLKHEDIDHKGTLVVKRLDGEEQTFHIVEEPVASRVARHLQERTGTEARVTSLGHVQRGGAPSAFDRVLCTQLGAKAGELLAAGQYNVMVAYRKGACTPVPLEEVAGKRNLVPADHELINAARLVGTCFGVEDGDL